MTAVVSPMPRKRKPAHTAPVAQAVPKRSRNHRTAQNPFEACGDEDYEVAAITARCWKSGVRYYEVQWMGYPPEDTTWEPW